MSKRKRESDDGGEASPEKRRKSTTEEPDPPKKRKQCSTPVLVRFHNNKKYGRNWILLNYNHALKKATSGSTYTLKEFQIKMWPHLHRNRIIPNGETDYDLDDNRYSKRFWKQFVKLTQELEDCKIHSGLIMNGYPYFSARQDDKSSEKLPLHQVPHYKDHGCDDWTKKDVFAHRCHNKSCLVHAVRTDRKYNIAQSYCKAYKIVGETLYRDCNCRTKCIVPGCLAWVTQV